MRFMACILVLAAAMQLDSCQSPKTAARGSHVSLMAAGNLNNLDVLQVAGADGFRYWRRDARGAWIDGGAGEGSAAAIAAWHEDMLVFFDTGRYGRFGLKETTVYPSPVPAWTPVAACTDGLAAEVFGWNASGEPILARSDGDKWTWERIETDLTRDRAKDVRLVRFSGRPYLVWREEAEPLMEKSAATNWRVRFVYKDGGRWRPVTSRLVIASAPQVASDGDRLIFMYQKPGETAWTLASYLTSDEDWHETVQVSGEVPAGGPLVLARQGSQFFVVALVGGKPHVAALDPATGRLGTLAPPAVEQASAAADPVSTQNLVVLIGLGLVALVLLAVGWQRSRMAAVALPPGAVAAASLVRRAIACSVDYVFITVLCLGGLSVFSPEFRARLATPAGLTPEDMNNLFYLSTLQFLYFIACEMAFARTLGKRIMGLKIVHENGGRASVFQALLRNLLRPIDYMPGLYLLGLAMIVMGPRPQRLGDRLARTLVVRDTAAPAPSDPPVAPRP